MAQKREDDLFRESTMTFGEHLEELRTRLFKAAMWLALGAVVGLLLGDRIVHLIESPLTNALKQDLNDRAKAKLREQYGDQMPEKSLDLLTQGYIFEEVYLEPSQALETLHKLDPSVSPERLAALQAASPPDVVPLVIWRKSADDPRVQPISMNPTEAFVIYIKASLLAGLILTSPMIFRELWMFVAAGLYPHERRYVHIFLPFSVGLFITGALLAFFVAFPPMLSFLFGINNWLGIKTETRISEWLSFVLFLPLAFGIGFQLPLVMLFMNRIGLFTVKVYKAQWKIAVVAIFVIAMILTPSPDIFSYLLLAVPMVLLYFGGILLCHYATGRQPTGLGGE